jgi:flagellar motor protein MotB
VVICCVLALAWQAHWQAPANARPQPHDTEIAKTWREAAQQLVESLLAEVRVLNSNQAALATSQVQIGAGLAKLSNIDTQLAALASTQASASRGLAAAQTALAQETTNLVASLRQTFQQGLAEATSQSRADTEKLQTQIAEVAASHRALLDRLSEGSTNVPNLAFALLGVRTKIYGNSILLTFDDGLFLHGTCFKPDAKSRLQAVAKALAQVSTPLRIEVIGCADDDRVFKRWTARFEESLALERASAVVNYFIELGLFAPKRLAALSSRGTDRPFPSDTVQNRAKNRTAVLRISTEEKPLAGSEPAP